MTAEPAMVMAGKPILEFQPVVDLATGRLLGMEALVRWQHPTKGNIPPSVLIPFAEANNDIIALGAWVLSEACRQAMSWTSQIQLAVNCSLAQLRQGEASKAVSSALEESGLIPDRLMIEVTERIVSDPDAANEMEELAKLGVHLAVDDVGTSWSSLQTLRKFAIETVKIDGAFVSSLEAEGGMNRALVEAIIHVSHSLAMSTVAEGVETASHVGILREFGADVGQGYFFSEPLGVEQAAELANQDPRAVFSLSERATLVSKEQPPLVTKSSAPPTRSPAVADEPAAAADEPAAAPRTAKARSRRSSSNKSAPAAAIGSESDDAGDGEKGAEAAATAGGDSGDADGEKSASRSRRRRRS